MTHPASPSSPLTDSPASETAVNWTNARIAAAFSELGERLQLIDDKPYRALAYTRAAASFRDLPYSVAALSRDGKLGDLEGIGDAIVDKVADLLATGTFDALEQARAGVPDGLVALTRMPGIGATTAKRIWRELVAESLDDVVAAAADGSLADLPKISAKTVTTILEYADAVQDAMAADAAGASSQGATEMLRDTAEAVLDAVTQIVRTRAPEADLIQLGDVAGGAELVTDLSALLWAPAEPRLATLAAEALTAAGWLPDPDDTATSPEQISVLAPNGATVRIQLPLDADAREELELRALAPLTGTLRDIDFRAELHCHTTWSDGRASVLQMAEAARAAGDTHMCITDHSAPYAMVGGLGPAALEEQALEIAQANEHFAGEFTVLQGIECEILADGSLGLSDEVLEKLDWVVASIHVAQRQSADQLRERMERVLTNRHVDAIGHPTSRLLLKRPSTELDVEWLISRAAETGTALELNANPRRLDLGADWCAHAAKLGVPITINSDAHGADTLALRRHGVLVARRAGLAAEQVVNCWSLDQLRAWLAQR